MTPIIEIENLSKRYRLGSIGATTFRESWQRWLRPDPADKAGRTEKDFWALRDVSFTVQPGETLGIIGSNGAGKSTLLKVLSRITEPTSGRAVIRGRVASLLEVGTGFHPDLTGRENIFLNGAILGMRKAEIRTKFDEIVAFAEVDRFIDTPVKRYSSGMYVRLAFAVAAHLEPEILIVDEVLAVGDSAFQKRCLGKMHGVAQQGRTVLFVSHNMSAINTLCERAICFAGGKIAMDDVASSVTERYLAAMVSHQSAWERPGNAPPPTDFHFESMRVVDAKGETRQAFNGDESPAIEVSYAFGRRLEEIIVTARIDNSQGTAVFEAGDTDALALTGQAREPGSFRGRFSIPGNFLSPGRYTLTIGAGVLGRSALEVLENVISFEILPIRCAQPVERRVPGIVSPLIPWQTRRIS